MARITASITTSLDGYITGPHDGPGRGLGEGGTALHSWVFGGPWDYDEEPKGEATGEDKAFLDEAMANLGAVIVDHGTGLACEQARLRRPRLRRHRPVTGESAHRPRGSGQDRPSAPCPP